MFKYKPQFRDAILTVLEHKRKPRERRDYFGLVGIESDQGLGWVEVALLMALELKGVFTGVEEILRQRKQDVMKSVKCIDILGEGWVRSCE